MSKSRARLSPAGVDTNYPHQITMSAEQGLGSNFYAVQDFCKDLSISPLGHSYFENDRWYHVYCFKEKTHAEAFQERFGGEWFDPKTRGRGSRWATRRDYRGQYPKTNG